MGFHTLLLDIIASIIPIGLSSAMIYFGDTSLGDCTAEPMIPIWLMGE